MSDYSKTTLRSEVAPESCKLQKERLHTRLLDAVQEAVIATDLTGRVIYWNRFAEKLYGWSAEEAVGRPLLELKSPTHEQTDAEGVLALLQTGGTWSGESDLKRRDGSSFPAHVSDGPIFDEDGNMVGIVGISYDISPRKEAEKKRELLIRELHHRVKNTLATVQAILGTTARNVGSIDEFQNTFTGRVMALAKAHALLSEDQWQAVDFALLLRSELHAGDEAIRNRIVLDGPTTILSSNVAVPLGMAIHELKTNAVKHGALAHSDGRVTVYWDKVTQDGEKLSFVWTEHDGPPVKLPTREGFGSRLLRRLLNEQIGGDVKIDYAPHGLRVSIVVPLSQK